MKFDAFEILRSEKELNEFGYYAEIRSRIAEAFVLDLLLSKELYILDIPEEKLLDLFSTKVTSPDKVKMKVNKLIQK